MDSIFKGPGLNSPYQSYMEVQKTSHFMLTLTTQQYKVPGGTEQCAGNKLGLANNTMVNRTLLANTEMELKQKGTPMFFPNPLHRDNPSQYSDYVFQIRLL